MGLKNLDLNNLVPKFEFDEIFQKNMDTLNKIRPLSEVLAEQIAPIIEGNKDVINGLNKNYETLYNLYILKQRELEESRKEAEKAKKYNTKMLVIALVSAGIALASLVATILIAIITASA